MGTPLSTLLSQVLVARTIEFDDVAEQRILHGTTVGSLEGMRAGGVWFTSQVMWTNYIRHLAKEGRPVREVQALACESASGIKSRLHHLEWWHYVTFAPAPNETRAKPPYLDLVVSLTPNGQRAAECWAPISDEIDRRWRERFGKATLDKLAKALRVVVSIEGPDLPDHMPVVGYGNGMRAELVMPADPPARDPIAQLDLSALVSRSLLALTLEYESRSDVSLTAVANVLRVVDDAGTPLRELPLLAGVAKEGQVALVNFLKKHGHVTISADKLVRLTDKGTSARDEHTARVAAIERRWQGSAGLPKVAAIRAGLEAVLDHPKLAEGLTPHQGGWRLEKRYEKQTSEVLREPRMALPHHPMMTHRGGFPDGS